MMVYNVPLTRIHVINILSQIAFDCVVVKYAGINALVYFILSSFLAGSLHPCAAHFIAEHYVLDTQVQISENTPKGTGIPETFSYYGPLNLLTYNVGLHNEHHDFPAIPWTRLPHLHETAKEFYKDLPHHKSWTWVIWQFIHDKDVGLWCRVKREKGRGKVVHRCEDDSVSNRGRTISSLHQVSF